MALFLFIWLFFDATLCLLALCYDTLSNVAIRFTIKLTSSVGLTLKTLIKIPPGAFTLKRLSALKVIIFRQLLEKQQQVIIFKKVP